jgi:hypothetical protein
MTGVCNGTDQVELWSVTGETAPAKSKIAPWRQRPILIVGVELTKYDGGQTIWWMAGKGGEDGDTMIFMGPGEDHGRHDFSSGAGMLMPGKADAKSSDVIDLHGACKGDWWHLFRTTPVHIFYTIYYIELNATSAAEASPSR